MKYIFVLITGLTLMTSQFAHALPQGLNCEGDNTKFHAGVRDPGHPSFSPVRISGTIDGFQIDEYLDFESVDGKYVLSDLGIYINFGRGPRDHLIQITEHGEDDAIAKITYLTGRGKFKVEKVAKASCQITR